MKSSLVPSMGYAETSRTTGAPIPPSRPATDLDAPAIWRALLGALRVCDHVGGGLAQRLTRPLHTRAQRALVARQAAPRPPLPVPRLAPDQLAEFRALALTERRPVILAGYARGWTAIERWSFAGLGARFAAFELEAFVPATWDVARGKSRAERLTLGRLLERMVAGEPLNATFLSLLHAHPELLGDFDLAALAPLRPGAARLGVSEAFLGAPGTRTPIHAAPTHNLFVQVLGEKRWLLYGPACDPALRPQPNRMPYFVSAATPGSADAEHPLLPYAQGYTATLEPGDLLYVPAFWWHEVCNPTLALGVAFRWNRLGALLRASWLNTLLALTATRPTVWGVRRAQRALDFSATFRD